MPRLDLNAIQWANWSVIDRRTRQTVPLNLNPPQQLIRDRLAARSEQGKPMWAIVLKGRRCGSSTYSEAVITAHCIAFANARAMTIAHKGENAKVLFETGQNFHRQFFQSIGTQPQKRKSELLFPHSGGVSQHKLATAGTAEGGRGLMLSALLCSECAFYENAEDVFTGYESAVSPDQGSICIYESTANGRVGFGERFYEKWSEAVAGESEYEPIFISWLMDPGDRGTFVGQPPELFGQPPYSKAEEELMKVFGADADQIAFRRWAIVNKCVAGETRIGTEGGLIRIDCAQNAVDGASSLGPIRNWFSQGRKPVKLLRTMAGRILRATPDHKIRLASGVWAELQTLRNGDAIQLNSPLLADAVAEMKSLPRGSACVVMSVTEEVGLFLGYFMGDGSWQSRGKGATCEITCDGRDRDIAEEAGRLLVRIFGASVRNYVRARQGLRMSPGAIRVQAAVTWHEKLFVDNGLLEPSPKWSFMRRRVQVPEVIFRSPEKVVRAFLSGLFEADGCISNNQIILTIGSKHGDFGRDVQLLLLACGIPARIRRGRGAYGAWYLLISGLAVDKFCREIGFRSMRKQARYPVRSAEGRQPAKIRLVDTVESVVDDGEAETYDIEVGTNHAFSANGVEVHNCQGSEELFLQEYPHTAEVAFLTSGDPAFLPEELMQVERTVKAARMRWRGTLQESRDGSIELRESPAGYLKLWEKPQRDHRYYIGADAARGLLSPDGALRGDFSAAVGIDGTTGRQVFTFEARISITEFSWALYLLGHWFNKAMINIEHTGGDGFYASRELRDTYHYPNFMPWRGKNDKRRKDLHDNFHIGWETTWRSRQELLVNFREVIRTGEFTVTCPTLRTQMYNVEREGMDYRWEVRKGHDDVFVAACLAVIAWQLNPPPKNMLRNANLLDKEGEEPMLTFEPEYGESLRRKAKEIMEGSSKPLLPKFGMLEGI